MRTHTQLTQEQRYQIYALMKMDITQIEIALDRWLGVGASPDESRNMLTMVAQLSLRVYLGGMFARSSPS
ncbi:MAG: hypothetical protein AMJ88_06740 [Anaerolineae bacterium SM23_ 63]|nr:MAG: hypothetical protein AMJ88_06740 [Anaerolineae bacterium SM23_ 63]